MDLFTGVGVALVTLMDDAGDVDAAATGTLAAELADRGMRAVLACGTTGEAGTLTDAERVAVIRAVRDALPSEVQVLAGTRSHQRGPGRGADHGRGRGRRGRRAGLAAARVRRPARLLRGGGRGRAGLPVLAYHIPWISSPASRSARWPTCRWPG